MITQTINLNLIPGGVLPRINVSQYDKGARTLQFNLYNGVTPFTIPDGSSVYVVGTKADRTGFDYEATYTGGLVSIDVTEQMTAFAGDVEIEIRIIKSGEQIATGNFVLCVERTALADDTVISETDIPIIQHLPELVAETEENAELAHKWATFGDESEEPSATNNAKYWAEQAEAAQDLTYDTATGNPVSFTTDSSGISKDTIVTLEPIQSGSGDPSPTNVRPISGYNEIEVNGCGVNVWDEEWEIGAYNLNNGQKQNNNSQVRCKNLIPIKPSTNYCYVNSISNILRFAFYDINGNFIDNYIGTMSGNYHVFTTPQDARYLTFYFTATSYSGGVCINYPSTDTSYHAYTGHRITSPLPSTIYGGTYDVETGELTVDRALVDLGTLTWTYESGETPKRFRAQPSNPAKYNTTPVCSNYASYYGPIGDIPNNAASISGSGNYIFIRVRDDSYSDAAAFKTAMSGVQLAYELATPYTISLEPHLLNLFEGQNNVSTNGTQISVTYRNGIVARVDDFNAVGESFEALTGNVEIVKTDKAESSALAPVENGATASQPYAVGDYLYRDSTLYRVTSAIASGATFTVDTNITATTVMEEIVRLTQ